MRPSAKMAERHSKEFSEGKPELRQMGMIKKRGGSLEDCRPVARDNRLGGEPRLSELPGTSEAKQNDQTLIVVGMGRIGELVVAPQLGPEEVLYVEGDVRIGRKIAKQV